MTKELKLMLIPEFGELWDKLADRDAKLAARDAELADRDAEIALLKRMLEEAKGQKD